MSNVFMLVVTMRTEKWYLLALLLALTGSGGLARAYAQTANTADRHVPPPPPPPPGGKVTSLRDVRTVFIDKMPNNLDQYLRAEISKKFGGTLTVVLDASQADGILTTETANERDTTKATVSMVDPSRKIVLWSAAAGDRKRLTLDIGHGGEHTVAERLIGQLKKAMQSP